MKKSVWALAAAAALSAGSAFATPVTGTFTIYIYHTTAGGGLATSPAQQANLANPLLAGAPLATVTYTGALNFFEPANGVNTIAAFLSSGGGTYAANPVLSSTDLSLVNFTDTTVFDIRGTTALGLIGTITHDDGATLYQNGIAVASSAAPTFATSTPYTLSAGDYRLIYVAGNALPEQLVVDGRFIPEPTSVLLASVALLGLGVTSRRARKAA